MEGVHGNKSTLTHRIYVFWPFLTLNMDEQHITCKRGWGGGGTPFQCMEQFKFNLLGGLRQVSGLV
jgi:hypothetical protein